MMKRYFWPIIMLGILILGPLDAILLWVQYPNPTFVNVLLLAATVFADGVLVWSLCKASRSADMEATKPSHARNTMF